MTTDANGSATQDAAAAAAAGAGTPDPATGGAAQGSNGAASDPFAGLETGTREWIGTKGYKGVSDLAKAAQNAESLIGRSVQIPGENAKPEEVEKFYERIGAPKEAKDYDFKLPDKVPDTFSYDESFAGEFKEVAKSAHLTKAQAAQVHDFYVNKAVGMFGKQNEALVEGVKAASAAMEKAWGEPGSERFREGSDDVLRAIKGFGIEAELERIGALVTHEGKKLVLSAPIAFALELAGKRMFSEGGLPTGMTAVVTNGNPFAGDNATDQGIMWNRDRQAAMRAIQAVGKKPEDFGLKA